MAQYYLAVDIGASGGRHIIGYLENGKIKLKEVYRFENGMKKENGSLYWDVDRLFSEIKNGMKACAAAGMIPVSMAIDTWAVDYVLLDENDRILGETYGYRDHRTDGMDEEVYRLIPEKELYSRTGIQKQIYNTIYQLAAVKKNNPEYLKEAKTFLLLPDYFDFLLTGNKITDYTNATTTQLVNAHTNDWDDEIISRLGFPRDIFLPLSMPGTEVGSFTKEIRDEVGFDCKVILSATHDTASAVMAVPSLEEDTLYISSGTWSLIGVENMAPICTEESRVRNFTNEGGYDHRFRYLKNIMGLWIIQSVRHEMNDALSFAEFCAAAEKETDFPSRIDVNSEEFLSPENMTEAIKEYCRRTMQRVPERTGELSAVIYHSLAESYAEAVKEIEEITHKHYTQINIVGGGSNADYLNRLTAEKSGLRVLAGPGEASSTGNLVAQMIASGEFEDLTAARRCIRDSFDIKVYD